MKKFVFAAVVAAASTMSSAALAQAYVSAAVGQGHLDADCSGVASCDNTGTAAKVTGGYTFAPGFSGELGYITFGKTKASDGPVAIDIKIEGFTLGVAFRAPLGEKFGFSARAGVARLKSKVHGTVTGVGSASDSETHTKPYFGIGADYVFNKNFRLEAGVDFSKAELYDEKSDVRAVTIGARFDF